MLIQTSQKRELFASTLNKVLLGVFAVVLLSVAWLSVRPQEANAVANSTLNFQARLEASNGAIAPDGNYNVEFKLYNASTGGTNLWTEDYTYNSGSGGTDARVRVANGYLSVNLGSITPFPNTINWDQQLYLTMNIGGTVSSGTITWDGEMNPRLPLTSVPYAFQAQSAQQLQTIQGSNTGTLGFGTLSANQSILLPDASGTVCLDSSVNNCNYLTGSAANGSYIQLQSGSPPGTQQTGNFNISGTGTAGTFNATTALQTAGQTRIDSSGNLTNVGTITASGGVGIGTAVTSGIAVNIQGSTADTTASALNIQNSTGTGLLNVRNDGTISLGVAQAGGIYTFGLLSPATVDNTDSMVGYIVTTQYTTGLYPGKLTSISVSVGNIDANPAYDKYRLAIYSDSGNAPGTLIAQSAEGTLTANSVNTLPVSASLNANTTYWLAYKTNPSGGGTNNASYTAGSAKYCYGTSAYGAFPTNPTMAACNSNGSGIYGTYTVVGIRGMYVASSGNVGIDTTGPAYPLDVSGDVNTTGAYRINGTAVCTSTGCMASGGSGSYIQNGTTQQTSANFNIDGTGKAGTFNATTALQTAGQTRIDASGNLTNIGNIGGSGTLQLSGTSGVSYIQSALGLGTTNPQAGSALTIANGSWIAGVNSAGTGYVNMFQVNSSNQIQVGAALNIDGGIILPTDAGQVTFSDLPIDTSATAGTPESYTFRVGSSNVLTVYGEADGSGNMQNGRVAIGSSIAPAYTLDVGGDVNVASGSYYRVGGTPGVTQTACSAGDVFSATTTGGIVTGGACNPVAVGPGSTYYIQNGTTQQTGANFNIDGTGTAATLQAGTFDTAAAGALGIGTTNATSIVLSQNTSVAAGKTLSIGSALSYDTYATGSSFATPVTYPTGTNPYYVTTGDFNGDGILDLAIPDNGSTGAVSILLGNGNGTFQPKVDYATGSKPTAVVAGDFNGDGKLDLAVTNSFSSTASTVSILLGNGNGTFQPKTDYTVGGYPYSITTGDFNGDGILDLAIPDNGSTGAVSILLGNGNGTFQPKVDYATGSNPIAVVAGDFNGDGKLDLAVTNGSNNTVSILLGNGDGTFQPKVDYATGGIAQAITTGDFNGDGKLDLAVANYGTTGTVSILLGNGDGTFQPKVDYATGEHSMAITTGDFNGDGKLDLAVTNVYDIDVSILLGNGDGTFQPKVDYDTSVTPYYGTTGDFNGDGKPDLAEVGYNNELSVLINGATLLNVNAGLSITPPTSNSSGIILQGASGGQLVDYLHIQDSSGTPLFVIDKSGNLGVGVTSPKYAIDVSGDINVSGAYRVSGTAGATTTCSSGDVISNAVVQGGIITSFGCATNGGGVAPTLQNVYDNSATANPQIQLSSANGGLKIRDASTTVGTLFALQNSAGTTTYLGVTATGVSITGNLSVSNGVTVSAGGAAITGTTNINTSGSAATTIGSNTSGSTTTINGFFQTASVGANNFPGFNIGGMVTSACDNFGDCTLNLDNNDGSQSISIESDSGSAGTYITATGVSIVTATINHPQAFLLQGTTASSTAPLAVFQQGATPGAASDVLQLQNSSGTALGGFNYQGNLYYKSGSYTNTLNTTTLTASQTITLPNASGTLALTNDTTDFIRNQTAQQTSANFNIDGTGVAGTLQAANFDTATALAPLNIGTTNASTITIGKSTQTVIFPGAIQVQGTVPSGPENFRFSVLGELDSTNTVSQYGFNNDVNFNPQGASLSSIYGLVNKATISGSSLNVGSLIGATSFVQTTSGYTGTVADARGMSIGAPVIGGSNLFTGYTGLYVSGNSVNGGNTSGGITNKQLYIAGITAGAGTGGTVSNYGIQLTQPSGTGGTTNNYGLYIQGNGGGSTNYAIYSSSTAASLLSGSFQATTVNATSGYQINGTAGATVSCTGGQFLQNQVVQGGITTGGTCASAAAGLTGSGTDGTIAMFSTSGTNLGNSILTQDAGATTITVTGALAVTNGITVSAGGAAITGTTNINTSGSAATNIGNASSITSINGPLNVASSTSYTFNIGGQVYNTCWTMPSTSCMLTLQTNEGNTGTGPSIELINKASGTFTNINGVGPTTISSYQGVNIQALSSNSYAALYVSRSTANGTAPIAVLQNGATPTATADILQLQNSSNTVLGGFNNQGNLYYKTGSNTVTLATASQSGNYTLTIPTLSANDTICTLGTGCGSGSALTLQNVYDNSTSPATIALSTGKGVVIQDNATTVGNIFQIQDSTGSNTYLNVTSAGIQANSLDTVGSVGLNIGTTNATGITLGTNSSLTTVNGFMTLGGTTTGAINTKLNVSGTLNSSWTGFQYGIQNSVNFNPQGASISAIAGFTGLATISGSSLAVPSLTGASYGIATTSGYTGQVAQGTGLSINGPSIGGSQLLPIYNGLYVLQNTSNGGNTSGTIYNRQARIEGITAGAGTGGTVYNYGIQLVQPSGTGGTTNNYGLYIQGNGSGTSGDNYSIYNSSTAASYFAGAIQGTTASFSTSVLTPTIDTPSAGTLSIGTNATNTTGITLGNSGAPLTVQSSVTAQQSITINGAFNTSSNYRLFNGGTMTSTFGSSSLYAIQNQVAFNIQSGTITNVYGMANGPILTNNSQNIANFTSYNGSLQTYASYTGQVGTAIIFQASDPSIGGPNLFNSYAEFSGNIIAANSGNTSGTISNYGFKFGGATAAAGSGGTLNNYGMYIAQPSGSGAGTTNNYGLYIQGNGGGSTNYSIYNNSTAVSYFAGAIQAPSLDAASASGLNIGTTNANAITIGNGNSATSVTINAGTGALNIGTNAVAHTVTVGSTTGASAVTIQSGTGALSLQTQGTGGVNIATNAVAQTVTIGNSTGATSVVLNAGTGAVNIGTNAVAHTTTVGSVTGSAATSIQAGTGGLKLGSNGLANTIQVGNTTGAVAQTINLGNNATASSTTTVTVGSLIGASATTIQAGSGGVTVKGLLTSNNGITISAGQNFVNGGSTLNSASNISLGTSGTIGAASATVDAYTTFNVTATAGSLTFTLPNPTVTTSGRLVYINNVGTNAFTINGASLNAGVSANFIWNGSAWTTTAVSTGVSLIGAYNTQTASGNGATIVGNSIYFQSASGSTPGLIDGTNQSFAGAKTFTGGILTSTLDTASAGALTFGGATATSIVFGNTASGNYITFTASGGLVASGTAQHVKTITLPAEYAGAVLDAQSDASCTSANNGTLTSGYDSTNRMNYYDWTSTQTSAQCYDVVVQVPVPSDFNGWAASNPLSISLQKDTNGTAAYAIQIIDSTGTTDSNYNYSSPGTLGTTWANMATSAFGNTAGTNGTTSYAPGNYFTIKVRVSSMNGANVDLGNITLNYNSKF